MTLSDSAWQSAGFSKDRVQDLSSGRIRRAIRTLRRMGLSKTITLARQHGFQESLDFAARNIRHIIADRHARRWDRRHGVDTAGSIQLHSLSIVGPNRDFGNECVCTSPKSFDFMMRSLPSALSDYTFVDFGAGKSRTLLLASRYGFSKIVGVEFAKELVDCSKRNITRFKGEWQRCRNLQIVEADATQFAPPNAPLVMFFYNPFTREVFDAVLQNIVASLEANKRRCYVIYGSSSHDAIDWAKPAIFGDRTFRGSADRGHAAVFRRRSHRPFRGLSHDVNVQSETRRSGSVTNGRAENIRRPYRARPSAPNRLRSATPEFARHRAGQRSFRLWWRRQRTRDPSWSR